MYCPILPATLVPLATIATQLGPVELEEYRRSLIPVALALSALRVYWASLLASVASAWLASRVRPVTVLPRREELLIGSWFITPYLVWGYQANRQAFCWINDRGIYNWRALVTALLAFCLVTLTASGAAALFLRSRVRATRISPTGVLTVFAILLSIVLDHLFALFLFLRMDVGQ